MDTPKRILTAVDLHEDARTVLGRALDLAQRYDANVYLIHVVEPIGLDSPFELHPSLPANTQQALEERANSFLTQLVAEFKLQDIPCLVSTGSIKQEIFNVVNQNNIDMIVIGTHGRHGIASLFGSTASSVLHGTPCDVYAVKL